MENVLSVSIEASVFFLIFRATNHPKLRIIVKDECFTVKLIAIIVVVTICFNNVMVKSDFAINDGLTQKMSKIVFLR